MLSITRLKHEIKRLPKGKKLIGLGSLFVILSIIMPWYSDLDAWGVGKSFSALTGPLYLVGFFIFVLGVSSGVLVGIKSFTRKELKLPMKESLIQMGSGILMIFFLIIANSVFFHKDFGVNILRKETRFGMLIAFAGSVLIGIGGYLQNKQEVENYEMVEEQMGNIQRPLIDLRERATGNMERKMSRESSRKDENPNLQLNL